MEQIIVNNLGFGYGKNKILDNISFCIEKGEFIGVIGGNGAGKSTLIKLLLGQLLVDTGSVEICGCDIKTFREWNKIGYVPQPGLSGGFPATVTEVVTMGIYKEIGMFKWTKKLQKNKVREVIKAVGIEKYQERVISKLSGGQKQRVMIAKAIVNDPDILLLDEPEAGIDYNNRQKLYELLKEFNSQGMTILMVTHELDMINKYANRVISINDGKLI